MTEKNTKNDKKETNDEHNGYLFSIDVLIKGRTNGHALEVLTHLLNEEQVTDYRIIKGINLGQIISANLDKPKEKITQPKSGAITDHKSQITTVKKEKENKTENKTVEPKNSKQNQPITEQIEQFKEDKSLVRITINKGKGVKLSIPCRILNFDWTTKNITAYHVDEKKVYSIDLNEIDDLTSG
ncbi:MAG: hypothetical protein WDZ91_12240 [Paenibacillaceae bacterium]